jgi:hypothetical protein
MERTRSEYQFRRRGQQVIAQRYATPAYVELETGMSATEITITKAKNKTREDWMIAEQNLKRAIMDSVGLTIRQIIAPFQPCRPFLMLFFLS